MGDSSSFSSLISLVNSHLSSNNINGDSQPSTSGFGSFKLSPFNINRGSSDTTVPSNSVRFPMPSTSTSEHPINDGLSKQLGNMHPTNEPRSDMFPRPGTSVSMSDSINEVLAMQLSNMFKAREAKEEMRRKLEEEKAKENLQASCMIDLMPAINRNKVEPQDADLPSSGSSMESLIIPDITENYTDLPQEYPDLAIPGPSRATSPMKPLNTDMSYILKHKIGKCSQFGKVLCARYRPVAAPYFRVNIQNKNIKVFDFSTPSPDDINKMKAKTGYRNSANTMSIFDTIMQSIPDDKN